MEKAIFFINLATAVMIIMVAFSSYVGYQQRLNLLERIDGLQSRISAIEEAQDMKSKQPNTKQP